MTDISTAPSPKIKATNATSALSQGTSAAGTLMTSTGKPLQAFAAFAVEYCPQPLLGARNHVGSAAIRTDAKRARVLRVEQRRRFAQPFGNARVFYSGRLSPLRSQTPRPVHSSTSDPLCT